MTVMPRPSILSVEPYVGGESKIPGVNRIVKLSSNEGAFGPPPGAIEAIRAMAPEAHRYPDGSATALREAIGARFGLDPARIVVGNGSDELLALLILAYGGEGTELVMSAHGFLMYDITGRWAGCRVIKVPERNLTADVDGLLAAVGPRTRLVFLANPNNPTGSILPQAEVERLRAGLREDILLVLDAAYAEYVTRPDYDAGAKLVDATGNTVMTRTFSKIFGMGGMRLGWAYAPAPVVDILGRVRGPFNVNAAAMAAGVAALAEPGWIEKSVAHNTAWRGKVSEALSAAGIRVWPSEGNFVLADFGTAEKARAADAALRARGLIVRAMGGYGLPQALRITIGTAEECTMVIEALSAFMHG
ncbi:histidinol-phosphate transaminase [Roseomonas alkaliterrae]|uniref:Histidinol-phosphate aminotransferase n=1 Tax=Neoroseomonas alkaliterrae TaxID=1452450 RepID=A0A840XSC4_9PROT|nr:histidinol-phosphate transaminase [Neoroseomonas alkaliterrae]MBB5691445.1 histidinol-phosphate aminotransferase [Neoroseomonas alkaliterrae]MBR0678123.1 histidinol-phosphate transaminase [Neoroseomonas alkaliterrae]